MPDQPARVLLGVTGGVAAYKAAEIVRRLRDLGAEVTVAATPSALTFVGEPTFAALSGRPVLDSIWARSHEVPHVSVARASDVLLIAPATADFLVRLSQGRADDVLGALVLMAKCPVLIAPAMHTEMWEQATTQAAVSALRSRGFLIIEPAIGRLTGPDSGAGRLPTPESLAELAISAASHPLQDFSGRQVLISAGGTREPLDPVRWLGNRSSGRMGYALATAAVSRGALVTVVAANVDLPDVAGARTVRVSRHSELRETMIELSPHADVIAMVAAVADYSPHQSELKLKKTHPPSPLNLELLPTSDVLAELVKLRTSSHQHIVGFAAETVITPSTDGRLAGEPPSVTDTDSMKRLRHLALTKLAAKGCDVIVANDVSESAVFGSPETQIVIAEAGGQVHSPGPQSKLAAAHTILDVVLKRT